MDFTKSMKYRFMDFPIHEFMKSWFHESMTPRYCIIPDRTKNKKTYHPFLIQFQSFRFPFVYLSVVFWFPWSIHLFSCSAASRLFVYKFVFLIYPANHFLTSRYLWISRSTWTIGPWIFLSMSSWNHDPTNPWFYDIGFTTPQS